MKKHATRKAGIWRRLHLADRLLLVFLAVLLIQSGHNLFAHELSGNSAELDVVVRTTMAAIFGYFISTGVNRKTGTSQSVSAPVKIGFSLPEEGASLRMEGEPAAVGDQEPLAPPVQEQGEEKPDAGWQLAIVGIIGLGAIGRRVAEIAHAFGAKVIYYSASGAPAQEDYEQVDFETLLTQSDIISVHAPLNEHTEGLINSKAFEKMKSSCIFLNLGRGPIVDEQALYNALVRNQIAAAGLDVLCEEPMSADNPLLKIKDSKRLLITPHIAWASVEARTHLMEIIHKQVKDFFA